MPTYTVRDGQDTYTVNSPNELDAQGFRLVENEILKSKQKPAGIMPSWGMEAVGQGIPTATGMAGGALGSLTGTPVGTLAGGLGGALVGNQLNKGVLKSAEAIKNQEAQAKLQQELQAGMGANLPQNKLALWMQTHPALAEIGTQAQPLEARSVGGSATSETPMVQVQSEYQKTLKELGIDPNSLPAKFGSGVAQGVEGLTTPSSALFLAGAAAGGAASRLGAAKLAPALTEQASLQPEAVAGKVRAMMLPTKAAEAVKASAASKLPEVNETVEMLAKGYNRAAIANKLTALGFAPQMAYATYEGMKSTYDAVKDKDLPSAAMAAGNVLTTALMTAGLTKEASRTANLVNPKGVTPTAIPEVPETKEPKPKKEPTPAEIERESSIAAMKKELEILKASGLTDEQIKELRKNPTAYQETLYNVYQKITDKALGTTTTTTSPREKTLENSPQSPATIPSTPSPTGNLQELRAEAEKEAAALVKAEPSLDQKKVADRLFKEKSAAVVVSGSPVDSGVGVDIGAPRDASTTGLSKQSVVVPKESIGLPPASGGESKANVLEGGKVENPPTTYPPAATYPEAQENFRKISPAHSQMVDEIHNLVTAGVKTPEQAHIMLDALSGVHETLLRNLTAGELKDYTFEGKLVEGLYKREKGEKKILVANKEKAVASLEGVIPTTVGQTFLHEFAHHAWFALDNADKRVVEGTYNHFLKRGFVGDDIGHKEWFPNQFADYVLSNKQKFPTSRLKKVFDKFYTALVKGIGFVKANQRAYPEEYKKLSNIFDKILEGKVISKETLKPGEKVALPSVLEKTPEEKAKEFISNVEKEVQQPIERLHDELSTKINGVESVQMFPNNKIARVVYDPKTITPSEFVKEVQSNTDNGVVTSNSAIDKDGKIIAIVQLKEKGYVAPSEGDLPEKIASNKTYPAIKSEFGAKQEEVLKGAIAGEEVKPTPSVSEPEKEFVPVQLPETKPEGTPVSRVASLWDKLSQRPYKKAIESSLREGYQKSPEPAKPRHTFSSLEEAETSTANEEEIAKLEKERDLLEEKVELAKTDSAKETITKRIEGLTKTIERLSGEGKEAEEVITDDFVKDLIKENEKPLPEEMPSKEKRVFAHRASFRDWAIAQRNWRVSRYYYNMVMSGGGAKAYANFREFVRSISYLPIGHPEFIKQYINLVEKAAAGNRFYPTQEALRDMNSLKEGKYDPELLKETPKLKTVGGVEDIAKIKADPKVEIAEVNKALDELAKQIGTPKTNQAETLTTTPEHSGLMRRYKFYEAWKNAWLKKQGTAANVFDVNAQENATREYKETLDKINKALGLTETTSNPDEPLAMSAELKRDPKLKRDFKVTAKEVASGENRIARENTIHIALMEMLSHVGEPIEENTLPHYSWLTNYLPPNAKVADMFLDAKEYVSKAFRSDTYKNISKDVKSAGECLARWAASHTWTPMQAELIGDNVVRGGVDRNLLGAVGNEDNLRSRRKELTEKYDQMNKLLEARSLDYDEKTHRQVAQDLNELYSLVGPNKFFETEEDYQQAKNRDDVKEGLVEFERSFGPIRDKLYRLAADIGADVELPTRGLDTGVRFNLLAKRPTGELGSPEIPMQPDFIMRQGKIYRGESKILKEMTGKGQSYETDIYKIIQGTLDRTYPNIMLKEFVRRGQEAGFIKLSPTMSIKGEKAISMEVEKGKKIYFPESWKQELDAAFNAPPKLDMSIIHRYSKVLNQLAITGLTDFLAHTHNDITALLMTEGMGGAAHHKFVQAGGIPAFITMTAKMVSNVRGLRAGDKYLTERIAELTRIGAAQGTAQMSFETPGWQEKLGLNYTRNLLLNINDASRLCGDEAFNFLRDRGIVEDTETARRDFINNAFGQYNSKCQGAVIRFLRGSGMQPFAVAGKTFTTGGVRAAGSLLGLGHISEPIDAKALIKIREERFVRSMTTVAQVAALNYLFWGSCAGLPGTPLGAVSLPPDPKTGRKNYLDFFWLNGIRRGLRSLGGEGSVSAWRRGGTLGQIIDAGVGDVVNTGAGMVEGPPLKFALNVIGTSGEYGFPSTAEAAVPGQSQMYENVLNAINQSNPFGRMVQAYIKDRDVEKSRLQKGVKAVMGTFPSPIRSSKWTSASVINNAQLESYIKNSISTARNIPKEERMKYLTDSAMKIDDLTLRRKMLRRIQEGKKFILQEQKVASDKLVEAEEVLTGVGDYK